MRNFIAIDVGGTSIKYGVLNEDFKFLKSGSIETRKNENKNFILEDIDKLIEELLKDYKIDKIGISTAGVVHNEEGYIIHAGNTIPGYTGTKIKESLEEKYKIEVKVENDVNSAALGEAYYGSGKGYDSIFMMTIGTGIGGAFINKKELFYGSGNNAGEVGYIRINGEEIQNMASTTALVRNVEKRVGKKLNGKKIFDLAQEGNKECIEEINNILNLISELIANIVYTVNPEVIILGGGIMERKEYVEEKINKFVEEKLPKRFYNSTRISLAALGNKAGLIGAVAKFI